MTTADQERNAERDAPAYVPCPYCGESVREDVMRGHTGRYHGMNPPSDDACQCAHPYLGAQLIGTPLRCEVCRCLVDDAGVERLRVAHEKALRELNEWAAANPTSVTPPVRRNPS